MANLPAGYASLRFGRKTIDFYAVAGEVVGSDPRARAEERRIQDLDGARHTLRLMDKGYRLEPGDTASVLRLQPGPERRSRPVAVASPSARSWTRTHPGAPALLSRAGVSRNLNWALTMALFALAALAIVWPYLHAFLIEIAPGRLSDLPAPNVFALAAAYAPGLEAFRWSQAAAPLAVLLDAAGPGLAGQAGLLAFAAIVAAGAVVVYAARSWRLLWAPVFVAIVAAGAIGIDGSAGAEGPALAALGACALLFVIGGVINRLRDEVRLDRRIALLAEHLVSQTPSEHVRASRLPDAMADRIGAGAIAASALREPAQTADAAPAAADMAPADADALDQRAEPVHASDPVEPTDAVEATVPAEAAQASDPAPSGSDKADLGSDGPDEVIEADGFVDRDLKAQDAPEAPADAESVEEARLRDDPRYAARAIVLPAPPPMAPPQAAAETPAAALASAPSAPAGAGTALQADAGEPAVAEEGQAAPTPPAAS
ncbi:MAG: hypothetical protein GC187_03215 [Alphaproteobacteria bacterium]|nr:hypothetical protein [Alphaproteobacteria bacterium]